MLGRNSLNQVSPKFPVLRYAGIILGTMQDYVILAVFQVFFVNTEPANKTFKTALEQIDIL